MKIHRIFAIIIRYIFLFRHSFDRLSDVFYWPTIDLLMWGLTSSYFKTYISTISPVIIIIVSGLLFWLIIWRAQYEITVNVLEDLWNKNLINIFVSPITFSEWITAFLILGIIKATLSLSFAMLVAFLLYKVQIFFYGYYLIPFILLLLMSGWWVGFLVAGFILRFGSKVQVFAWASVWALAPFSAVYYPVAILPWWAQIISMIIPTSYIFEGARQVISTGMLDQNKLYISFALNVIYLILSSIFLKNSFQKTLLKGLVKVY